LLAEGRRVYEVQRRDSQWPHSGMDLCRRVSPYFIPTGNVKIEAVQR
jgi:hypothetical protein